MRVAVVVTLLLAMGAAQAATQPLVRIEVKPTAPLVGQQIRVGVTVMAPNFFLSPPQFPLFDVPGAVVVLPDEPASNSTETINGESYAGVRRDYLITPLRAGVFALPPAQFQLSYAAVPGEPPVASVVTLPPTRFTARVAETGQKSSGPALIGEVIVTQSIDGDPKNMKVGDALTRRIEIFASETQAMMIPPTTFSAPAGVRVYPRDPVLSDAMTDRGGFRGGRRVDEATYVFEKSGAYALPAIEVRWFDPEDRRANLSKAAEIEVKVAEAPLPPADLAPPTTDAAAAAPGAGWLRGAAALLAFAAVVIAALLFERRFGARIRGWAQSRRKARAASEAAAFAKLKQACRSQDAAAAYRALEAWARSRGERSVEALWEGQSEFRDEVASLERRLYGRPSSPSLWNGPALLAWAEKARASRRAVGGRSSALPELNPR